MHENTNKIHILTVNHSIGGASAQKKNPKWIKTAKNPRFYEKMQHKS
jgi:hypothetical protein